MEFWVSIAACGLAGIAMVTASLALRFAVRVTALPNTVLETVNAFHAEMESYRTKVVQWRQEIEAVLEQVEDTLDRTETKRRSIAASTSKVTKIADDQPSGSVDPMQMTRIELERYARTRGLMS